jgi:dTDP-4-amino-4,6-dideoxygalactose transaminase
MRNIPFFRPAIGAEEKAAVMEVLDSGWLTTGKVARQFEEEFAQYIGAPWAVAVNSCTAALHLALEAIGVGAGDGVLVPSMTFAATAEVVRYMDARPILVDCDPATGLIDIAALEQTAEEWQDKIRLRAIIPVHYAGQMVDVAGVQRVAARFGLDVIEDAAHTLPAHWRANAQAAWQSVGTTAKITCFSFYANKCITTGEGGMAVSTDEKLAERMRMMSLHGLSRSAWSRFEAKGSWYYEIVAPGFKYNLTDVAAAIGLAQLRKAEQFNAERRVIAETYTRELKLYPEFFETPVELADRRSSWHLYPLRLKLENLSIDRARFIDLLKEQGIVCSVHWMPLHMHPYYVQTYGYKPEDLPQCAAVWPRLVSLPISPAMPEADVRYVIESVAALAEQHSRVVAHV